MCACWSRGRSAVRSSVAAHERAEPSRGNLAHRGDAKFALRRRVATDVLEVERPGAEPRVLQCNSGTRSERVHVEAPEVELRETSDARQRDVRLPLREEFLVEEDVYVAVESAALHTVDCHGVRREHWELEARTFSVAVDSVLVRATADCERLNNLV